MNAVRLERRLGELAPSRPGAALVAYLECDGLAWSGVAGSLSLGPAPVEDHQFRVASITKTFVAAAVHRAVELGALALTDSVDELVDDALSCALTDGGYDPAAMTLAHLLSHTSGLPDYAGSDVYRGIVWRDPSRQWSRLEQVQVAMDLEPVHHEPGSRYAYSDTGYVLLGEVLERVVGPSLPAAVRALLRYDELGLDSTYWEWLEQPPAAAPRLPQRAAGLDVWAIHPSMDLFGGGGIVSTCRDIARFVRCLLQGQVFKQPSTLARMLAGTGAAAGVGDGIFRVPDEHGPFWGHTGFWGAVMAHDPKRGLTVVGVSTELPSHGGFNPTSLPALLATEV